MKIETPDGIEIFFGPGLLETTEPNDMPDETQMRGALRRELIWTLGETQAAGVITRWGYACGQNEARLASNQPLLRDVKEIPHHGPLKQDYVIDIKNSKEVQEHQTYYQEKTAAPQCWFLSGYLTGYFSGKTGYPIYFFETECRAKGDAQCRFIGKTKPNWANHAGINWSFYKSIRLDAETAFLTEQLKLTRDRYQNLFEQANVPIFIVDLQSAAFLDANIAAEVLAGHSKTALLKMNIFDLYSPKDHHQIMEDIRDLSRDEKISEHEISLVRETGDIRTVLASSKMIFYGGTQVIQMVIRDITDLKVSEQKEKDLQQQLIRSERLSSIGRLAAGVAHELKNPLGAIRNALYYIRQALNGNPILESDPDLKGVLNLAEQEVDGSVAIIGELLDFSRVVTLMPRKSSINEVVKQMSHTISAPENIELALDLDPTLPAAMVDPDRLRQVFVNIATNAIQAMTKGGTLSIQTGLSIEAKGTDTKEVKFITVNFTDTGCGIAPHHLAKIFEPLFTTKARGTGLGLAISNNIIEKHGGVILVTSQIDKGTRFTVKLPLETPADPGGV